MSYPIYELKIKPLSPWITDLTADTIFGHLCWQIKYEFGKETLEKFLKEMNDKPIFTLSDVLPSDRLPRPLSKWDGDMGEQKVLDFNRNKRYKEVELITFSQFEKYYYCKDFTNNTIKTAKIDLNKDKSNYFNLDIENKNIINRNTWTTSDWWIYSQNNNIWTWLSFSLYVKIFDEERFEKYKILDLLKSIFEVHWFWKKKSTWKWTFSIEEINTNFTFFQKDACSQWKNCILLSNFIPSEKDSTNWYYKLYTKFPKLGEEFSSEWQNFYKKPLTMIQTWATFQKWEHYEWYVWKMFTDVWIAKKENKETWEKWIYHYAYWFTLDF